MGWSHHFCRLRRPATPLSSAQCRFSFISPIVTRRAYADSQPSPSNSSNSSSPSSTIASPTPRAPETGALAKTSIFEKEAERVKHEDAAIQRGDSPLAPAQPPRSRLLRNRNPSSMAAVLDPNPSARIAFERRKLIQEIRTRGRLSKDQVLKRTERHYVRQSDFHKTGMKKVAPLARQIAGKTVDDAIVQMRFSKKKAATWILDHLIATRNRAVVERGMGLGAAAAKKPKSGEEIKIELKDGRKHKVKDQTAMYIDQVWVNKGPYGRAGSKRAKRRIDILRLPQTAITIQLKEEATRIREWKERAEKEERKKPWMQLPNRPISAQRPYYSW